MEFYLDADYAKSMGFDSCVKISIQQEKVIPVAYSETVPNAKLMAEDVWDAVQEWYKSQGKGVPAAEAKACLAEIAAAKKQREKDISEIGRGMTDAEYYAAVPPAYGTPEFWKAYHAKKKAAAKK